MKILARKAVADDATAIHEIIRENSDRDLMLPREVEDIRQNIENFFVAEVDGEVAGSVAVKCWSGNLAEIRSLSVPTKHQKKGLGRLLVETALRELPRLDVQRVFCLTYVPDFFAKFGFTPIDKLTLPEKIWTDCVKCRHFGNCTENAMIRDV